MYTPRFRVQGSGFRVQESGSRFGSRFGVPSSGFSLSSSILRQPMALAAGTRLGVYEIVDALGAGGMGEVYRARDTKLRREVAIKILPEAFAADPDRVSRF